MTDKNNPKFPYIVLPSLSQQEPTSPPSSPDASNSNGYVMFQCLICPLLFRFHCHALLIIFAIANVRNQSAQPSQQQQTPKASKVSGKAAQLPSLNNSNPQPLAS